MRRVDSILNASFVLVGIVTTLLGPLVPLLTSRWAITNLLAGYLFTAQFLGSLAGVSLSSLLTRRWGFQRLLVAGTVLMGMGVGTVWFAPWPESIVCVVSYGIGLGLVIPTSNILIAQIHRSRPSAALNTLNFAWGLGAVASSVWVGILTVMHGVGIGLACLGVAIVASSFLIEFSLEPLELESALEPPRPAPLEGRRRKNLFRAVAIGLMFYLYVGTENSVAGWVAAFAKQVIHRGHGPWVLAPGFFWAALLGGRAIAPGILKRISDRALLMIELPVAVVGIALLTASHSIGIVFAATVIAGAGLAMIFPGAIAMLTEHFGKAASQAGGFMFGLAALGGATLPWGVGYLTTRTGDFRAGLAIPLAGALAMWVVFILMGTAPPARVVGD